MTRLLLATPALLLSCADPLDVQSGTLVIELRKDGSVVWPWGGGTRMTLSDELDDRADSQASNSTSRARP